MSVFRRKREDAVPPAPEASSAAVPVARDPELTVPPFRPAPPAGAAAKDPAMSLPPKPNAMPGLPQGMNPGGMNPGMNNAPNAQPSPFPGAQPRPGAPSGPMGGPLPASAAPQRPQAPQEAERRTLVVGKGISLQGTVSDAERLVVEGTVESQMSHAHELNISGTGVFKGEVEVENAEVAGVFDGTITARGNLVIRATGRVLGVARCRRLQVEDGGQLSGRMEMLTDNNPPRMGVPAFPSAEPAEV